MVPLKYEPYRSVTVLQNNSISFQNRWEFIPKFCFHNTNHHLLPPANNPNNLANPYPSLFTRVYTATKNNFHPPTCTDYVVHDYRVKIELPDAFLTAIPACYRQPTWELCQTLTLSTEMKIIPFKSLVNPRIFARYKLKFAQVFPANKKLLNEFIRYGGRAIFIDEKNFIPGTCRKSRQNVDVDDPQ